MVPTWRLGCREAASRTVLIFGSSRSVFVVLAACGILAGCSPSEKPADRKPRFAFVVNVPTDRFWDIAFAGCLQAAKEEGVLVEFHAPNESTAQQQKQIVENLLSRGIDGIAISPLNPESMSLVIDEAAELCPVICQDSDAPSSKRACYIGTNNIEHGRRMGELIKQALPEGGQVALLVGQLDVANARERQQGVTEALDGSNIEIVGTFTDGAQPAEAKRVALDVLAKYPNLKGFVGLWGYNGPQAVNALQDVPGRNVVIVGSDESEETCRVIREKKEFASVAQEPFEFGYRSIKTLAKLHRGEPADIPPNKTIHVASYDITNDNVDAVEKEIAEKLSLLDSLRQYAAD